MLMEAMTFLFLLLRVLIFVLRKFLGQHVTSPPYFIVQQPNQIHVFSKNIHVSNDKTAIYTISIYGCNFILI